MDGNIPEVLDAGQSIADNHLHAIIGAIGLLEDEQLVGQGPHKEVLSLQMTQLKIVIFGPMIYTAPYIMFLMRSNPLQGALEGLGHESRDFLGPLNSSSEARAVWAQKKSRLSWPNPSNGPSNGFAPIKHITYRAVSIRGP